MMATYHAFHYGKMNQSFKMEDENNRPLFEANLVKFRLFTASDYEFVNHLTIVSVTRKVGKTTSVGQGFGSVNMTTASYFKLDGRNCFDCLADKGYSIKLLAKLDLLHPEFELVDASGNQVAVYKMNVTGEREEGVGGIGNKQSNTLITTESDDVESIFLAAFILGTVDFSLYLL